MTRCSRSAKQHCCLSRRVSDAEERVRCVREEDLLCELIGLAWFGDTLKVSGYQSGRRNAGLSFLTLILTPALPARSIRGYRFRVG